MQEIKSLEAKRAELDIEIQNILKNWGLFLIFCDETNNQYIL
jgi:hypothetical protein